jgi:hypothetical protein
VAALGASWAAGDMAAPSGVSAGGEVIPGVGAIAIASGAGAAAEGTGAGVIGAGAGGGMTGGRVGGGGGIGVGGGVIGAGGGGGIVEGGGAIGVGGGIGVAAGAWAAAAPKSMAMAKTASWKRAIGADTVREGLSLCEREALQLMRTVTGIRDSRGSEAYRGRRRGGRPFDP